MIYFFLKIIFSTHKNVSMYLTNDGTVQKTTRAILEFFQCTYETETDTDFKQNM